MNDSDNKYYGVPVDSAINGTSKPASIYLAKYNLTLDSVQYNSMSEDAQIAIVNVTREYPFNYATIMFGYIMPFVLILTIITNGLVVVVLAQRHMRTPTNIVLLTMAIVDMMTLLSPSPWYFYIYTLGHHDKLLYPPICCYFHYVMTDVVPVFFHTSSIWLALLLAGQRYIYVCHPTLASTWCTVPRVKRAIIIILLIAFLHQFTRLFDNTFVPVYLQTDFGYQLACKNEIANWVQQIDIAFYYTTYFTFRILFVLVIPCVALITLNCLLFGALRRAENKRTELLRTKFKAVSGNCASTGAMPKPSGYTINNGDRRAVTEPASGLLMALARRPSSGCVAAQRGSRRSKADKARKFSIIPVNMRCLPKLDRDSSVEHSSFANTVKTGNSSFKKTRTDTRSGFMFEDPSQLDRTSCGVDEGQHSNSNEEINANQGRIIRDARLNHEDSNDNCSIALQAEVCCLIGADSRQQEEDSSPNEEKQLEINRRGSGRDPEEENQSNKGEDSDACFECATCKHSEQLACQACSTVSTEGATCGGPAEATSDPHQQAYSQCSSLIGGATIGTNEDISSCVNTTQNLSSTLFVAQDGTMDGIEIASMRGDDADIDQENLSLQNNDSRLKGDDEEGDVEANDRTKRDKLGKSGSMDSRLTCGCLHRVRPQLAANLRQASLKMPSGTRRDCIECYRSEKCRNSPRGSSNKRLKAKRPKCLQSSSSDQSLDCKEEEIVDNEASQDAARISEKNNDKILDSAHDKNARKRPITSNSDYGNEISEQNKPSNDDTMNSGGNATVTTATANTTTTTTLYSTNANSIGSLAQVQQQNQTDLPINRRQPTQMGVMPQARIKSPSFASSTGGGRGSRQTSVAGPNLPLSLSSNMASNSASIRTMDSNRTTLMLIVVVTVFLLVEVPVALVTILHVVFNTLNAFADVDFAFNYIKLFTNFFIMISYSVNFTIYCSMSKKFRETFRDLFLCGKRDRRRRFLYQQQQQSQCNQHQFNNSNNPDNQVMTLNAMNINNNATILSAGSPNELNHNAGLVRYCPYRRGNSQQQECEL